MTVETLAVWTVQCKISSHTNLAEKECVGIGFWFGVLFWFCIGFFLLFSVHMKSVLFTKLE